MITVYMPTPCHTGKLHIFSSCLWKKGVEIEISDESYEAFKKARYVCKKCLFKQHEEVI
jgi:hypothetical protein